MYNRIQAHGENLNAIFSLDDDPVSLCKKLRRWETKGRALATDFCNDTIGADAFEQKKDHILSAVQAILNRKDVPVIFNSDPRGYCLKISDHAMRCLKLELYMDMGGYGIIAPDLS